MAVVLRWVLPVRWQTASFLFRARATMVKSSSQSKSSSESNETPSPQTHEQGGNIIQQQPLFNEPLSVSDLNDATELSGRDEQFPVDYSYFKQVIRQATDPGRGKSVRTGPSLILDEERKKASELLTSTQPILSDLSHIKPKLPAKGDHLAVYVNESRTLQKLVQLGVDLSVVEKDVDAVDFILKSDFETDLQPYLMFLVDQGVPHDKLGMCVTRNPGFFKEPLENLQIRIDYLESKKFDKSAIGMILTKRPEILSLSTKSLDSELGFLQKEFKLTGAEVREAVTRVPKLVLSNRFIVHNARQVMTTFLGFTAKECVSILVVNPKVFLADRRALETRFDYIHNVMGISHELIVAWPNILLTRLLIIKPRHKFLQALGRDQFNPTMENYVSLKALATGKDRDFCHFVANMPVEKYNEFLKTQ